MTSEQKFALMYLEDVNWTLENLTETFSFCREEPRNRICFSDSLQGLHIFFILFQNECKR
jgi:hypothetical protein